MPYELYKVMHIAAIFIFLTSVSILLFSEKKTTFWKVVSGVSSLFILVGGMGLMARLYPGIGFQQNWILVKLVIWLVVAGLGHMVAKRFPEHGAKAYWATILLAVTATWLAVYKPF